MEGKWRIWFDNDSNIDKDGLIPRGINLIFEKIKEKEIFGWKVNGGFCLIMIQISTKTG